MLAGGPWCVHQSQQGAGGLPGCEPLPGRTVPPAAGRLHPASEERHQGVPAAGGERGGLQAESGPQVLCLVSLALLVVVMVVVVVVAEVVVVEVVLLLLLPVVTIEERHQGQPEMTEKREVFRRSQDLRYCA